MKCSSCGIDVPIDAQFCFNCGVTLNKNIQSLQYEIKYSPSYSMLVLKLSPGSSIVAEAGALTYMTPNIKVRTRKRETSLLKSLKVNILGSQSFFINEYHAVQSIGELGLVAAPVGDIAKLDVTNQKGFIIQKSAYIASSPEINLDIQWQGLKKGLFGQGLFMVKTSGIGELFINTFGAIDTHTLHEGEELIVDNFHLVGFTDTCSYHVEKFGGWKETILSGEGFITRIKGPGDIYIQTKNLREFVDWLWTLLERRVRSTAR